MSVKFDFNTLKTGFAAEWPVTVKVPQDGGDFQDQTFMARFKALNEDERKEAQRRVDENGETWAWVGAFFVGLGAGEEPLTPELKAMMVSDPIVRQGLVGAYMKFTTGVVAKN